MLQPAHGSCCAMLLLAEADPGVGARRGRGSLMMRWALAELPLHLSPQTGAGSPGSAALGLTAAGVPPWVTWFVDGLAGDGGNLVGRCSITGAGTSRGCVEIARCLFDLFIAGHFVICT